MGCSNMTVPNYANINYATEPTSNSNVSEWHEENETVPKNVMLVHDVESYLSIAKMFLNTPEKINRYPMMYYLKQMI